MKEKLMQLQSFLEEIEIKMGTFGLIITDTGNGNKYITDEKLIDSESLKKINEMGVFEYDYN